jgi:MFS family permease
MTSLTKDATMNALVMAAGSLPMFLLSLPAGALADIVDRRKLIICTQAWSTLVAGTLAALTLLNITSPWIVIFFTFMMALGNVMTGPAWQAILPEIVKRRQIPAAMSLGGIAWNLSRITGPLLAGGIISVAANILLVRATAPGIVFAFNAVSYLAVMLVYLRWKRPAKDVDLPPEHILGAIRSGWRYTRHSVELQAILIRIFGFMLCASVQFSLLALYARTVLNMNASGYASLMGAFGVAAVIANLIFPRVREIFTPNQLLFYAAIANAFNLCVMAFVPLLVAPEIAIWVVRVSMLLGGLAWPTVMQTCNVTLVRSVPNWVRSRAAGMFTLAFMGGSTMGSILWGQVAKWMGIPVAFAGAALGLLLGPILLRRFVIVDPGKANFEPAQHLTEPALSVEPSPESGPVLVMVEYNIAPEEAEAFANAMHPLRYIRLRDGALRWNLFQDMSELNRWVETMMVESWNDYLRQRARITHTDREIEMVAQSFHRGEYPPKVSHLLASTASIKEITTDDDD